MAAGAGQGPGHFGIGQSRTVARVARQPMIEAASFSLGERAGLQAHGPQTGLATQASFAMDR